MLHRTFLLITALILVTTQAHALVEARINLGTLSPSGSLSDAFSGTGLTDSQIPDLPALPGYGADVLISLPLVPFGFGLRYETLGADFDGVELSASRTAILLNKRIIDTLMYVGPIASLGVTHSSTVKGTIATVSFDESQSSGSSYSVGVEAGVKLIGFIVGAELGYQSFTVDDSADLTGTYAKLVFGLGI